MLWPIVGEPHGAIQNAELFGLLFAPYVAVLDVALVFAVFRGDVRLTTRFASPLPGHSVGLEIEGRYDRGREGDRTH